MPSGAAPGAPRSVTLYKLRARQPPHPRCGSRYSRRTLLSASNRPGSARLDSQGRFSGSFSSIPSGNLSLPVAHAGPFALLVIERLHDENISSPSFGANLDFDVYFYAENAPYQRRRPEKIASFLLSWKPWVLVNFYTPTLGSSVVRR